MTKPAKINPCGIQLLNGPNGVTFSAFVEVKRNNGIENGAIVTISKDVCIGGYIHKFVWESKPIELAQDIKLGSKTNRYFLKLALTLTITRTADPCEEDIVDPPGTGTVTVTITNDPADPGEPEDADPVYFP